MPVPAGGQPRYEQQPAARLLRPRIEPPRYALAPGVTHLHTDGTGAGHGVQTDVEVPAGNMAVPDRIGGEFGDDRHERVMRVGPVRDVPGVQSDGDEMARETGAPGREGETHLEHARRESQVLGGVPEMGGVGRHTDDDLAGGVA